MSLLSYIDSNSFLHIPSPKTKFGSSTPAAPTIIFFITGNPGLVAYYHNFLSLLTAQQDSTNGSDISQCVVAGFSLAGFEVDDEASGSQGNQRVGKPKLLTQFPFLHESNDGTPRIYSLQEQVDITFRRLCVLVDTVQQRSSSSGSRTRSQVVLMGHSVGAYIALEIVRLSRQGSFDRPETKTFDTLPQSQNSTRTNDGRQFDSKHPFVIQSCILLTPTIFDIAHSPSGRFLTPLLTYAPGLPSLVQLAVYILTSVVSRRWLSALVAKITTMPISSPALDTTVAFLLSRNGVRQALAMSHDEMKEIGPNKWGQDVWGAMMSESNPISKEVLTHSGDNISEPNTTSPTTVNGTGRDSNPTENESETANTGTGQSAPSFYFLFAESDHWVANATREDIIAFVNKSIGSSTSVEEGLKTKIAFPRRQTVVVEESGKLVHGWCISQSMQVADRVRGWLEEILAS